MLSDEVVEVGGRVYVRSTACLSNGEDNITCTGLAREEENKKGMDAAQLTGACSSYARKYALNGLFAIDDTKDADATNEHKDEVSEGQKAFLIALQQQLAGLETQLDAQKDNNKAVRDSAHDHGLLMDQLETDQPVVDSFADAFKDAAKAGQDFAQALRDIKGALGFLGSIGDIFGFLSDPFGLGGKPDRLTDDEGLSGLFKKKPKKSPPVTPKPKPVSGFPSGLVRPRAMGGPVGAGQSYLVGEQGPELFVPGMGGSIVPGGGINVTLQAGAFLGSSSDAREFARRVYSAIEEESKRRFTVPPTIRRGAAA